MDQLRRRYHHCRWTPKSTRATSGTCSSTSDAFSTHSGPTSTSTTSTSRTYTVTNAEEANLLLEQLGNEVLYLPKDLFWG